MAERFGYKLEVELEEEGVGTCDNCGYKLVVVVVGVVIDSDSLMVLPWASTSWSCFLLCAALYAAN